MTMVEMVIGAIYQGQQKAWLKGFRLGGLVGVLIGSGTFMLVQWWAR